MDNNTHTTAYLKTQIRLMLGADIALGPGKIELLIAIIDTGSISAAGRKLGMSYRRAWLLVDTMNSCFYAPLVVSAKGGKQGGGAHVTELGQRVLQLYQQMQHSIQELLNVYEPQLCALLKKAD